MRPTGKTPLVTGAALGYDPARDVWLVVGGQNRHFQQVNRTSECDGRRWREHRSRFSDDENHPPVDPAPAAVVPPEHIWYEPVFEPDPDADDNVDAPPAVGKVGGYPGRLQGDDTPTCAECQHEMRFVAQIPEVNEALRLFGGDWFLFCCPDEHTTALLAQR